MSERRTAAVGSLAFGGGAIVFAVILAIERFPRGVAILACLWIVLFAGWEALGHEGTGRLLAAAVGAVALVAGVVFLIVVGGILLDLAVVAAFAVSVALARVAFRLRVQLPPAPRPQRPVLFFNPRSGGGKAERFRLAEEAGRRGIEAVELGPGQDLRELVDAALARGADALAMAGGDGSQAIVAAIASERDLPYACVPAGTRNHFALDLGVDRNDVVGGLDALVDGGERRVDLAEVNGRVFVNNVSLGVYAEAVQREEYRDAKLRTLLEVAPTGLAPAPLEPSIRWRDADGKEVGGAVALLVSNDVYRLGSMIGSGTRPRLDDGLLGIAAATAVAGRGPTSARLAFRQWSAASFRVDGDRPVPAGIDGEAATLQPPIQFRTRPGALRVRIAPQHPGASPSTEVPDGFGAAVLRLARIAAGERPSGVD